MERCEDVMVDNVIAVEMEKCKQVPEKKCKRVPREECKDPVRPTRRNPGLGQTIKTRKSAIRLLLIGKKVPPRFACPPLLVLPKQKCFSNPDRSAVMSQQVCNKVPKQSCHTELVKVRD